MDLCGVAMVTKGGTVLTELAAGPADTVAGTECTSATRFQLCSVSKQFAAVAALLLAESGRLALDDTVDRWLPAGRRSGPGSRCTTCCPTPRAFRTGWRPQTWIRPIR
jgi:CubicO group peptidase (beta-lactamase class C family)